MAISLYDHHKTARNQNLSFCSFLDLCGHKGTTAHLKLRAVKVWAANQLVMQNEEVRAAMKRAASAGRQRSRKWSGAGSREEGRHPTWPCA
eukprot:scaffold155374_cov17-Tisochrysis_lutea.AAC.1